MSEEETSLERLFKEQLAITFTKAAIGLSGGAAFAAGYSVYIAAPLMPSMVAGSLIGLAFGTLSGTVSAHCMLRDHINAQAEKLKNSPQTASKHQHKHKI